VAAGPCYIKRRMGRVAPTSGCCMWSTWRHGGWDADDKGKVNSLQRRVMTDGPRQLPRGNRYTVDDLPEIDIHRLRREGAVRLGATTIMLTINGVERPIEFSWRPATLGSQVVTAKCPQCNAKRWRLYVAAGGLIGCRGCLQLTYLGRLVRGGFVVSGARRMRTAAGPAAFSCRPSWVGRAGI
jgi:hypothetical protein